MVERKFRVIRPHFGDKEYAEGDIRTADPADVAHLVPKVLEPIAAVKKTPAPKAAPKPTPAKAAASKKPRKR
jgi:hypothetical protein